MAPPKPPVPSDCDLRDFPFMPLDVLRLRDSEIAAAASGDAFRAAVLLWCAAWHQVPAGSLPNDEKSLARFSGFGRDMEGWAAVRDDAMRGFSLCSDGRLYHKVVAEKALESWDRKAKQRTRTTAATAARRSTSRYRNDDRNDDRYVDRDDDRNGPRHDDRHDQRNDDRNDDRNVHQVDRDSDSRHSSAVVVSGGSPRTQAQAREKTPPKPNPVDLPEPRALSFRPLDDDDDGPPPPSSDPKPRTPIDSAGHAVLEATLRTAAGLTQSPEPGLLDLSPIYALLDEGFDLDREIVPVLRARGARAKNVRHWRYFADAIRDSRTANAPRAGNSSANHASAPPTDFAAILADPEVRDAALGTWFSESYWAWATWGPSPKEPGCVIPLDEVRAWGDANGWEAPGRRRRGSR